ncbi:hypothetical protein [Bosea sp. (in: a-proteobacteria)]|uniref:hypothetical protein n=1 Tax=Bosea sp. (in: a-proteobacteria) TaxID=1871050 RepID=UPI002FCC32BD
MTQGQAPEYDRSGRFPVDEDGWQIVDLGRMLYPGGPHALRVHAPGLPAFHLGWRFSASSPAAGDNRVVISHIGAKLGGSALPPVRFTPAILARVQERLRIYVMIHPEALFGERITGVDFVAEDPMVEIF